MVEGHQGLRREGGVVGSATRMAITLTAPVLSWPAKALGHLHIFESPSAGESLETGQAIVECNGSWRLMGSVSAPSTELGDDPCGPGKGFFARGFFCSSVLPCRSL